MNGIEDDDGYDQRAPITNKINNSNPNSNGILSNGHHNNNNLNGNFGNTSRTNSLSNIHSSNNNNVINNNVEIVEEEEQFETIGHHYPFLRDDERSKLFRVACNHLSVGQFELARATLNSINAINSSNSPPSSDSYQFFTSLFSHGIPKQWFVLLFYYSFFLFIHVVFLKKT